MPSTRLTACLSELRRRCAPIGSVAQNSFYGALRPFYGHSTICRVELYEGLRNGGWYESFRPFSPLNL